MPSLFFFPILPFIMTVCLIVYWVVVAGYLYSAGTIVAKTTTGSAATALTISVSPHAEPSMHNQDWLLHNIHALCGVP